MTSAVAKRKTDAGAVASPAQPISESAALVQMIERAARDPNVDIDKMERLFLMSERVRALEREAAFNTAMAAAQAELIPVAKNQKNKQTGSDYADLAAIADAAMPVIHRHGFGLVFSEFKSERPDHVGVACCVKHAGGHSERHEFNIPVDGAGMKGNPNKTATHAYGSTLTYGRRYATCGVFNIATKDDDGNKAAAAGTKITTEDVEKLRSLLMDTQSDLKAFYEMFDIECLEDMPAAKLEVALRMLELKKNKKAK